MEIDEIRRVKKKAQKIEDKIIYLEKDEREKRWIEGWAALVLGGVNSVAIGKNAIVSIRPGNKATLGPLRTYFYYCTIVGLIPVIP